MSIWRQNGVFLHGSLGCAPYLCGMGTSSEVQSDTRRVGQSRPTGRMPGTEAAPGRGTPRAFDAVNFFLADVSGGLGPFLPAWLATAFHWEPERIGFLMTFGGIAGLACNTPGGALVDRFGRPPLMIGLGSVLILVGTMILALGGGLAAVVVGLLLTAMGGSVIGPAISAASLGFVGQRGFPRQQGRNAAWSNAGNVVAALMVLAGAPRIGVNAPVLVLGLMAAATIAALACLASPQGETRRIGLASGAQPPSIFQALRNPAILVFAMSLLFFHLGNAAMLPLLGLRLAHSGHGAVTEWMSACVIVAQFGMIGVAVMAGRLEARFGKVRLFLFACCVLVLRGVIMAFAEAPLWLVPIQILDALGAGTLGVITPPLIADLSWGSGRTQTTLGAVMAVQGVGASLSGTLGGMLITWVGWNYAFWGLAVPPVLAVGGACWLLYRLR
jgi:MFS family permease